MATQTAAAPATPVSVGEAQRTRAVWGVLALTSIAFLFLCAVLGMGLSSFINNATTPRNATVEPRQGTQLAVRRHNTYVPELITRTVEISEGDVATTGADTTAFLTMFDGSTVQTFFSTTLGIDRLRTARYTSSQKEITVNLRSGTAIIGTADAGGFSLVTYRVLTDLAEVGLAPGTKVRVRVDTEGTQAKTTVIVDAGEVTFISNGKNVRLAPDTMAWVVGTDEPVGPVAAEEELIRNGHFSDPPTSGAEQIENGGLGTAAWLPIHEQIDEPVSNPGSVTLDSEGLPGMGTLNAVQFFRSDTEDRYVKVGIRQDVNQPAAFLNSIELFATVRIIRESAPIGGPQGNLYPLTIRVIYSDSEGAPHEWKQSFYYVESQPNPTDPSQVQQGVWWAPKKRFVLKSAEEGRDIAVINAVEVYGYGREFQSWITGVSMVAR